MAGGARTLIGDSHNSQAWIAITGLPEERGWATSARCPGTKTNRQCGERSGANGTGSEVLIELDYSRATVGQTQTHTGRVRGVGLGLHYNENYRKVYIIIWQMMIITVYLS